MKRLAAAAALAAVGGALALGCSAREALPDRPAELRILAAPVEIAPAELNGVRLRGAVELTSDHPEFGGISGMLIDGRELIAVTDRAWLIRSPLVEDEIGVRPAGGDIHPLRDDEGRPLEEAGQDAEGLARTKGGLAVAFERDHRVEILDGDGPRRTIRDRRFEGLGYNEGLEALAALPDGRLLAIAEGAARGGFPVFVIDPETGKMRSGRLPLPGDMPVTDAEVGPDGRLYLLRRTFSLLGGFAIRIERYRLSPEGLPRPETREPLATFQGLSGIDNMEAIALWRDEAGRLRLAIASDDNFLPLQRTLLVDLEVLE
jgi:hypothetical protein